MNSAAPTVGRRFVIKGAALGGWRPVRVGGEAVLLSRDVGPAAVALGGASGGTLGGRIVLPTEVVKETSRLSHWPPDRWTQWRLETLTPWRLRSWKFKNWD